MKRALNLKKETLSELSTAELGAVAGAGTYDCAESIVCLTGMYPTLPVATCLCDVIGIDLG